MNGWMTSGRIQSSLLNPDDHHEWIERFDKRQFSDLPNGKGIGIAPFYEENLGPITYDLTVGSEAYSLRTERPVELKNGGFLVQPRETVIILTHEFIALGPKYFATTLSKASFMNQAIGVSAAKIDPTWYGCLPVPVTNLSTRDFNFVQGESFCALAIQELEAEISKDQYLPRSGQIGKRNIVTQKIGERWDPAQKGQVQLRDLEKLLEYGPPYDIVRAMFLDYENHIVNLVEAEWGKNALDELRRFLRDEEIKAIQDHRSREIKLLEDHNKVMSEIANRMFNAVVITILGWLAALALFLFKS